MAPRATKRAGGTLWATEPVARAAIIVIIIIVSALVVLVTLALISQAYRRRVQNNYDTISAPNAPKPGLLISKKSKMTAQDVTDMQELQRLVMIRKSLASRTSLPRDAAPRKASIEESSDEDISSSRATSVRSDWKEYEAGIQKGRSASLEKHPMIRDSPELLVKTRERTISPLPRSELLLLTSSPFAEANLASPPPIAARRMNPGLKSPNQWPQPIHGSGPAARALRASSRRTTRNPYQAKPAHTFTNPSSGEYLCVPLGEDLKPR